MGKFVKNMEEIICVCLLIGIVICTSLQIFSRFILDSPIGWTEELARFLMIWLVFFGASAGVKSRSHVKIELIINKLSNRWRKNVKLVTMSFVSILLLFLIYQGAVLTMNMGSLPAVTLPITWSYVYSAVPVGCTFILLRIIQYRTL